MKILMYHSILQDDRRPLASGVDPYYAVTSANFRAQMDFLKRSKIGAKRSVILTFDDGLKSQYELARPILKQYGFIGYFFVTVNNVGQKGYMNWEEIIGLHKAGHTIGSHGMSHRILTALDKENLLKELKDSRRIISERIGQPVDYFSVPGGFYNSEIKDIAKEAGYQAVLTSSIGTNRKGLSVYQWQRIPIKKNTTIEKFKAIIEKGRIPAKDKVEYFSKRAVQKVIGDKRYHRLRKIALQV